MRITPNLFSFAHREIVTLCVRLFAAATGVGVDAGVLPVELEVIEFEGKSLQVTVSVGGACLKNAAGTEDVAKLVEVADQRLYEAKHNGRNCFVVAEELFDFS